MIRIINGKVRQGKGVLLSLFGRSYVEDGFEVYANFPLRGAKDITPYEFVRLIEKEPNLSKVKILLQEVYGWLNSHKSMSNVSELEDTLVFQSGKLGYDIDCDTQVNMRVLQSLRAMCDERFYARKFGDTVTDFESGYFEYTPVDPVRDDELVPVGDAFQIPFKVASLWWDDFDTLARTKPLGYENLVASMASVDPKIKMSFVNDQVNLLLKNRNLWLKPDRVSVQCALLELGQSDSFCGLVANRLELRLKSMSRLEEKRGSPPVLEAGNRLRLWRR